MATLDFLKQALRQISGATNTSTSQPLSDIQYSNGFEIFVQGPGWVTYQDFVIPQLSQLLTSLCSARDGISFLEIGPGPKSVIGYLSERLRCSIRRYTAFEPNDLFATKLENLLCYVPKTESVLPCLEAPPNIQRMAFIPEDGIGSCNGAGTGIEIEKYDMVLFCHSMYGVKQRQKCIERALELLIDLPKVGMVVVFHRDVPLHFDGLVCHETAHFPTGVIGVADQDETLDSFASFVVGSVIQNTNMEQGFRAERRRICRAFGRREEAFPGHLLFRSPNVMMAFTQHATALPKLMAQVPSTENCRSIKNWRARLHLTAPIIRPTEILHVQKCVRWALEHKVGLTVVGGSHSGHCIWPNVVSIDMGAFDKLKIIDADDEKDSGPASSSLVVVEAGCKTEDIVHKTMEAGITVPLGSRPSVGAGLWLQGGIGHLARLHGLACDAIVGVVLVSVDSGQIFCVGNVPSSCQPAGAVRPEKENYILWAMKGAGTNFGIVISVIFKCYAVPTYLVRNWIVPLSNSLEAQRNLSQFDKLIARKLPKHCSADAYLYWDTGRLHLGITMFEAFLTDPTFVTPASTLTREILGSEDKIKSVDCIDLFDAEMYVSRMHGGHGSGKTSSFKRCLFLNCIGGAHIAGRLLAAIESRPSPLSYIHLLQGGGAIRDVAPNSTAFGCREWDFACIITGVWPRDQDGTEAALSAVQWVYKVAEDLLSLSSGAYGADLGPDPRDSALAAYAFGPNRSRLARLKHDLDPHHVLAYACPLPMEPKLIILVTGESCSGKDYCAAVWVSIFKKALDRIVTACAVSISDATKREYAEATNTDLCRLRDDRAYKEQHRPALTEFYQKQVEKRPRLPEEHFLSVVHGAADVEVLFITGMRDEAPVAAFSHLVPNSKLIEVYVQASEHTRRFCRGPSTDGNIGADHKESKNNTPNETALTRCPNLIFDNDRAGTKAAKKFAEDHLLQYIHEDLQELANMVRSVADFPSPNIEFRHVLGISQEIGGLALCTSLLQSHFNGDWAKIDTLACCETGGIVFASPLALRVNLPLLLIREAGKLPPPTISAIKRSSHISSCASDDVKEKRVEMERDAFRRNVSVVLVDDVLSTGETLCAILQLFNEAGIADEDIKVLVVAEFPIHRGRELLRARGFGQVNVQSLLVYSDK